MNISRITVGGQPVAPKFIKNASSEKVGQLIKESIGLAPKGITSLEARGIEHAIIIPKTTPIFKVGGLKTVANDLPYATTHMFEFDPLRSNAKEIIYKYSTHKPE